MTAGSDAGLSANTLVEATCLRIKADILDGALPPSAKLQVERLKSEYGVGSSTIREALTRLSSTALVVAIGQRGFRVAPMSLEDLQDLVSLRQHVECLALRLSIEAGNDEWEGRVVAAFHQLSKTESKFGEQGPGSALAEEWEHRNEEFHKALASACASRRLLWLRRVLYEESVRYRRLSVVRGNVSRDIQGEHRAIMEAALQRDAALATKLLESHIGRTIEIVIDGYKRSLAATVEAETPDASAAPKAANGGKRGPRKITRNGSTD